MSQSGSQSGAPPPGPPPPPMTSNPLENRGTAAIAVYWAEGIIAIIVVVLRFYARVALRSIGADDWLMLVTLILFLTIASLVTYEASLGGFKHLLDIELTKITDVVKVNYIMQAIGLASFSFGKAAVGCLILRLLGPEQKWSRITIWVTITLTFLLNTLNIIFTFVQCDPPRALWEPQIPKKCWDPTVQPHFALFVSAENILADVVLALLPITFLWQLNMSTRKRVNLSILLALGLLAAICGIVKTTFLGSLSERSDITWETYNLVVWSGTETWVIILCGSAPPLKNLWDKWLGRNQYSTAKRSYNYNSSGNSSKFGGRKWYFKQDSVALPSGNHSSHSERNALNSKNIRHTTDIEITSSRGLVRGD